MDRAKLFRKFDKPSLFAYAVETLGFSEVVAYSFAGEKLTVAKASRMVSGLTPDNAAKLIDFAIHHTTRETEMEVARLNPKKPARKPSKKLCTFGVAKEKHHGRQPLTAEQKHAVFARDQGCCTHRDASGRRCNSQHFVEVLHVRPVSQGGNNDPSNLTTSCSFHHDLAHQLTLPLDGQVTWLREREVRYEV